MLAVYNSPALKLEFFIIVNLYLWFFGVTVSKVIIFFENQP